VAYGHTGFLSRYGTENNNVECGCLSGREDIIECDLHAKSGEVISQKAVSILDNALM
jgi:hypothetical protein